MSPLLVHFARIAKRDEITAPLLPPFLPVKHYGRHTHTHKRNGCDIHPKASSQLQMRTNEHQRSASPIPKSHTDTDSLACAHHTRVSTEKWIWINQRNQKRGKKKMKIKKRKHSKPRPRALERVCATHGGPKYFHFATRGNKHIRQIRHFAIYGRLDRHHGSAIISLFHPSHPSSGAREQTGQVCLEKRKWRVHRHANFHQCSTS